MIIWLAILLVDSRTTKTKCNEIQWKSSISRNSCKCSFFTKNITAV